MKKGSFPPLLLTLAFFICSSPCVEAHESDTLFCHFDSTAVFTYTLYTSPNGGYLSGGNGYGDLEIAQKFGQAPSGDTVGTECAVGADHQLNEVVVYFGAKRVGNPNDSVYINVYDVDHSNGGPGALLGRSFSIRLNYIDTSSATETYMDFLMQLPVVFSDSFFLSVVFPHGAGDTVGVMTSTNGEAQSSKLCWVQNGAGAWFPISDLRTLDVDAAIFPVVGDVTIGIAEVSPALARVKAFPNPARHTTTLEYFLKQPVPRLQFSIADLSGRIVCSQKLNNEIVGAYTFTLDLGELPAGIYFYSFETTKKEYTGKLEILK